MSTKTKAIDSCECYETPKKQPCRGIKISSRQIAKLGSSVYVILTDENIEEISKILGKTKCTIQESERVIEVMRKPKRTKKTESNHPFKKYMK